MMSIPGILPRIKNKLKAIVRFVLLKAKSMSGPYICPVCCRRVQNFLPLPAHYSEQQSANGWPYSLDDGETMNWQQYSCPFCFCSDRDRLYALYVNEFFSGIDKLAGFRLIDFAPSLPLTRHIKNIIKSKGMDVDYRTADLLSRDVDDTVDIMNMGIYPDQSCNFFICSHILEHVEDDKKAMRELRRILKPKGRGILMVPIILGIHRIDEDPSVTDEAERWRRFGQEDHVRVYSKKGFVERLKEVGFKVHSLGREHFGETSFKKHAISNKSVLYVVEVT